MKKYKCLAALMLALLLSGCNAGGNAETVLDLVTETVKSETMQITTLAAVSEDAEISVISQITEPSQTVLNTTETQKTPPNYDVESIPYKAASIVYNEYLEFHNGHFEDWWVNDNDNDSPHMCAKVLIFDMNGDGRQELISLKWALSPYAQGYYTIYDIDSSEMLFNGYYGTSSGKLYYKDGQYCLKFKGTRTMAYVAVATEELENGLPNAFEALGYNEDYFYIGNKVNAIIYQYKNTTMSPPPYEGTEDSYCRSFSTTEGFTYYHGDYESQIEQQWRDFEINFESCEEIGELWRIGETTLVNDVEVDYSVDGIFGTNLPQRVVNDFDALVERLSLYDE